MPEMSHTHEHAETQTVTRSHTLSASHHILYADKGEKKREHYAHFIDS